MALGWQSVTANAAVRVAVVLATQATSFAAPAPSNSVKQFGWYQQLSKAVPVAQARQGFSVVPFNARQTNTVTIDKWQQPLSIAVPVAKTVSTQTFVPLNTRQVTVAPSFGWFALTNSSAKTPLANPTQATNFATPPPASNSVTQFGWFAPLSSPVAVAKAQLGSSFVPFNTVQVNPTPPPNGWFGQINPAAKSVAAQPTQATAFAVPPQAAGASTPGQFGWYAPLSKAVPVAQAQQGHSFVPFNTAQVSAVITPVALVYDAGYPRTAVVYYQSLFSPLPPIVAPSNTVAQVTWQQPLSVAVKSSPVVYSQPVWIPTAFPTFTLAWVQPLSKAVPVVKAQQGIAFVPFNTAQVQPAGIAGMAWFMPLGTVATSLPTAPQGISFVPLNTPQFVPPPPPPPPPPFHGWTPATKNIETWSTISNVNGLWIPAIKNIEGWT